MAAIYTRTVFTVKNRRLLLASKSSESELELTVSTALRQPAPAPAPAPAPVPVPLPLPLPLPLPAPACLDLGVDRGPSIANSEHEGRPTRRFGPFAQAPWRQQTL